MIPGTAIRSPVSWMSKFIALVLLHKIIATLLLLMEISRNLGEKTKKMGKDRSIKSYLETNLWWLTECQTLRDMGFLTLQETCKNTPSFVATSSFPHEAELHLENFLVTFFKVFVLFSI